MSNRLNEIKDLIRPLFNKFPEGAKFIDVVINPYFYQSKDGAVGFGGELSDKGRTFIAEGILKLERETTFQGENSVYVDSLVWLGVFYRDSSGELVR